MNGAYGMSFDRVINWAYKVGIFHSSNERYQVGKLKEEVLELKEAIKTGSYQDMKMELGDCMVVLCILAHMLDTDLEECLSAAVHKIEARKGEMKNGFFVKEG